MRMFAVLPALGILGVAACAVTPAYGPAPVYAQPGPGGGPPPPQGSGGPIEAGCSFNGTQLPGQPGEVFQIACPANCQGTTGLWGTDVYTADSGICHAAIHAGLISPAGGVVAVQLQPGRPAYRGSVRNGVRSNDYGEYR